MKLRLVGLCSVLSAIASFLFAPRLASEPLRDHNSAALLTYPGAEASAQTICMRQIPFEGGASKHIILLNKIFGQSAYRRSATASIDYLTARNLLKQSDNAKIVGREGSASQACRRDHVDGYSLNEVSTHGSSAHGSPVLFWLAKYLITNSISQADTPAVERKQL